MRRLAAVAVTSTALVAGLCATASPALADDSSLEKAKPQSTQMVSTQAVKFTLKKSGLRATTAYGRYGWGRYGKYRTRVIDAYIRDNKRGKNSCIHVVLYGRKGQNLRAEHMFLYNRHGKGSTDRVKMASYRLGQFAMRECEGYKTKRGFKETARGSWRWFK